MTLDSAEETPGDYPVAAYIGALVAYVALGFVLKSAVLNWIVGPLFLVIVLYLIPQAGRRLSRRTDRDAS